MANLIIAVIIVFGRV